jgi:hypothetical protein
MKDEICAVRYSGRKQEGRNTCKILAGNPEGKKLLRDLCVNGRIILKRL